MEDMLNSITPILHYSNISLFHVRTFKTRMCLEHHLALHHVVELFPTTPFHFDATLHKPDHFPSADTTWKPGIRWQTMRWQGQPVGLKFENTGTSDAPLITLSIWSQNELDVEYLLPGHGEIVAGAEAVQANFQMIENYWFNYL